MYGREAHHHVAPSLNTTIVGSKLLDRKLLERADVKCHDSPWHLVFVPFDVRRSMLRSLATLYPELPLLHSRRRAQAKSLTMKPQFPAFGKMVWGFGG